jgi:hypothetical protein
MGVINPLMKWAEHVAHMGGIKNSYTILFLKHEKKDATLKT